MADCKCARGLERAGTWLAQKFRSAAGADLGGSLGVSKPCGFGTCLSANGH